MSFQDIQFPTNISYGSAGGAGWLTRVVDTQAGYEYRSAAWGRSRGQWNVAHGLKLPSDYKKLINFFMSVAQGRLNGFRFKDWLDYTDWGQGVLALNTAGYNQLAKVYQVGSGPTVTRFIDKPVSGTVSITGGGTLNYNSGFVAGGTTGHAWTGQFDVPVRFDVDTLDMSIDQPFGSTDAEGVSADVSPSWSNIPIIEIRLPAPTS